MEYLLHAVPYFTGGQGSGTWFSVASLSWCKPHLVSNRIRIRDICTALMCVLSFSVWIWPVSKFLIPLTLSADAYPPTRLLIYNLVYNLDPWFLSLIGAAFLPIL